MSDAPPPAAKPAPPPEDKSGENDPPTRKEQLQWRQGLDGLSPEDWWTKKKVGKGKKRSEWEAAAMGWPKKLYMKTPSAVQAVNQKYPIKKSVYDESGWNRFVNTLSKGWADFSKWAQKHLGPLKFLVNIITGFVPFGGVVKTTLEKVAGITDKVLGGKEARDLNLYDILFIYRNCIVALLVKLAIDYKVPVDTQAFKKLFHTTPEFKKYLNGSEGGEFLKTLIEAEISAEKVITGKDEAEVPQTRKEARAQSQQYIDELAKMKSPEGEPMLVGKQDFKKWLK